MLDQLACLVSQPFAERLLGVPKFTVGEEHLYRLPGAWVAVQFKEAAINLLSITITDSDMWYRIDGLTIGTIDLRLGEDTFAQAGGLHDSEHLWMGNKQSGYYRHYHFGGAGGGHQHFWLSFNVVGAGTFDHDASPYASGTKDDEFYAGNDAPNPAKITVNTITVLSPMGSRSDVGEGGLFGPHIETINLSPAEQKSDGSRGTQAYRPAALAQSSPQGIASTASSLTRAPRYRTIAGPVSIRTRSIRMYPRSHSFGSTSDSLPAYGLRSPGSATEPE